MAETQTEPEEPTPGPRRARSRRGEGDSLRQELLDAARAIIDETNTAREVTVRRVAVSAGVSQAAVYLHFETRDELVYEVAVRLYLDHDYDLEKELQAVTDPKERIDRRGLAYMEFALKYPSLFHPLLMGNGTQNTPHRFDGYDFIQRTNLSGMIDDVRAAMKAGLIENGNPELVSVLMWMAIHGMVSLQVSIPEFPWPPQSILTGSMFELLAKGIGYRTTSADELNTS